MATPQEELLRQQQEKLAGIAQQQQIAQMRTPGQVQGETVSQFAQGKQGANSQTARYNMFAKPAAAPVVQQTKPVTNTATPVKPSGTQQKKQYTGGGDSSTAGANYLSSLLTSPQQEEELRKASVARQRILALGDIGRNIANMVGAVNGATPMQFNNPVEDERKRYLQEKALRDQNNLRYMNYQQMKAAQDAKMRQFEYQMQKDARDFELKKKESDARANLNEARIQRQQSLAALDDARLKGQISKNQYQELMNKYYPDIAESKIRETESRIAKNARTGTGGGGRRGSGSGSKGMDEYTVTSKTTYDTDPITGQRRGSTTTKTRTVKRPDGSSSSSTTTKKKALPGQQQKSGKKKLPGQK